jgi:hypothetical protein
MRRLAGCWNCFNREEKKRFNREKAQESQKLFLTGDYVAGFCEGPFSWLKMNFLISNFGAPKFIKTPCSILDARK